MELPPATVERLLREWPVARLCTVTPDGDPHAVPVVFAALADGALVFAIDGKPKGGGELARVRNLRAHPRVSLLLDAYAQDWAELWWLRADGVAQVIEGEGARAELAAAEEALRGKYPQYERWPLYREPPTAVLIRPERLASWCATPEAVPFRA